LRWCFRLAVTWSGSDQGRASGCMRRLGCYNLVEFLQTQGTGARRRRFH
jgi:hypothetical protein